MQTGREQPTSPPREEKRPAAHLKQAFVNSAKPKRRMTEQSQTAKMLALPASQLPGSSLTQRKRKNDQYLVAPTIRLSASKARTGRNHAKVLRELSLS